MSGHLELLAYLEQRCVHCTRAVQILGWAEITTKDDWLACMQKHNTWDAMYDFLQETVFANNTAWRENPNLHAELYDTVRTLTALTD